MPLVVFQGSGPSLLGRIWLQQSKHNWTKIHAVSPKLSLNNLLEKYASLTRIKHNNTVSLSLHYRLSIGQMFLHVGYQG